MAATRLMAIHANAGRTIAQCFRDRTDYAINPQKTNNGEFVTTYMCDEHTVAAEFDLSRRTYLALTGRRRSDEVIAYQLRQSFKPGEISPADANKVGCELAKRFMKGNHAYIVATHTDKAHIHNHIIFCATALDCKHKFRNFLGSGKALGRLSDQICNEHKLSVITDPKPRDSTYDRWLGNAAPLTVRDQLRTAIDDCLLKKPDGFEALMRLLEEAGIAVKRGKQISLLAPDAKRSIRMDTLGAEYSEQALRDALAGKRPHIVQPTRRMKKLKKVSLVIDIQAKLAEGKGKGYENWAKVFNVKQIASSMTYLSEHGIDSYDDLTAKVDHAVHANDELLTKVKAAESRMSEIAAMKKTIHSYLKTKDIYAAWKKSSWSKSFYAEHEEQLLMHKAAKEAFSQMQGKIPTIKQLSGEYDALLAQKQRDYASYREARDIMRELLTVKANVDRVTGRQEEKQKQQSEQSR